MHLAAFATALIASTSMASDEDASGAIPDTMFVVPSIVVQADRVSPMDELFNRAGFVARLQMGDRRGRVEDLSTALAQVIGVRVNQYGGLGSFATVSIRGSSSSQVKVYLDGIPLDDAHLGVTDVSRLPLGAVHSVEVYRGFTPPVLGAGTIGGAINLVTRSESLSGAEIRESYGSFDTSRHRFSLWSRVLGVRVFAHGGYSRSLGDFEFLDDNGTSLETEDDENVVRSNNDFDSWNAVARAEADVPRLGRVALGHNQSLHERGVPGVGSFQSQRARSRRRWRMSHLRVQPDARWSRRVTSSVMGFYARSVDEFDDPDGAIALSPRRSENTIRTYGGRASARVLAPWLPVALEAVVEGRKEQFFPVESLPASRQGPNRWRRSHTTVLGGELYLLDQALVVSASQRFQWQANEFFDDALLPGVPPTPRGRFADRYRSPCAGVRWQLTQQAVVKANVGRYHRLPTFLEMFGDVGAVTGNSALVPEEGLNRDLGATLTFPGMGLLEVVYLHNETENLILFFPNSQRTSKPVNIGSATIRGVELSAATSLCGPVQVAASYSWLDTEDTSDIPVYAGNRLPTRPTHNLSTGTSYASGAWRVTYELHYLGANYLDRANMQRVPGRTLHNVIVNLDVPLAGLSSGLSLTLEGRNLSDERASDVGGFPLPGRSFYSTLSYRYSTSEG